MPWSVVRTPRRPWAPVLAALAVVAWGGISAAAGPVLPGKEREPAEPMVAPNGQEQRPAAEPPRDHKAEPVLPGSGEPAAAGMPLDTSFKLPFDLGLADPLGGRAPRQEAAKGGTAAPAKGAGPRPAAEGPPGGGEFLRTDPLQESLGDGDRPVGARREEPSPVAARATSRALPVWVWVVALVAVPLGIAMGAILALAREDRRHHDSPE